MMLNMFSCVYCPSSYIFGRNIYSSILPTFNQVIFVFVSSIKTLYGINGARSLRQVENSKLKEETNHDCLRLS